MEKGMKTDLGTSGVPAPGIPIYNDPATDLYGRVVVNPLPETVKGVKTPIISLNGQWSFTMTPPNEFWRDDTDVSQWDYAKIPGDLDAQGFAVYEPWNPGEYLPFGRSAYPGNNIEMAYKRLVDIPADYEGNKVFLRVDKAFSYARVWVNGHYVREHRGEFNAWDADITNYVLFGQKNWITISIKAEGDGEKSFIGLNSVRGIVSDVTMYSVPVNFLNRLHVESDLDEEYKDAQLTVMTNAFLADGKTAEVKLSLKDPKGNHVPLAKDIIHITENFKDTNLTVPVENPLKWDPEHPNLYTLTAELMADGKVLEVVERRFGFRKITIENSLYKINGVVTKLRGVNYHTEYGNDGVAYDFEAEKKLIEKLKQNNVNYLRAAHYPLSDKTLELCDEIGMFVEQENSCCFAGGSMLFEVANGEFYRTYLLHMVSEMVEKDRSHPCIVIWSIANESVWGSNHDKTSRYIKAVCPQIPVNYSWGAQASGYVMAEGIDIHSNHYGMDGVGAYSRPTLWDEYAHGYTGDEGFLDVDPGMRENYYYIIKKSWDIVYDNPINMGGAIWDYTDNVYEGKNLMMGNTTWGQVDAWGREKPEIWATKNVYAPAHYCGEKYVNVKDAKDALCLPYENRYETVNFSDEDVEILYTVNDGQQHVILMELAPKETGNISIPAPTEGWKPGDKVTVEFFKTTAGVRRNVVTNIVNIGKPSYTFVEACGTAPKLTESEETILVTGEKFELTFSKESGKLTKGTVNGDTVLVGGPHLNLGTVDLGSWILKQFDYKEEADKVVLIIDGSYSNAFGCTFTLYIDSQGRIETKYRMVNTEAVHDYEIGISYDLPKAADRISWVRDGWLNYYPEDQLGRLEGCAVKERRGELRLFGVEPSWPWKDDDKDFYLHGRFDQGGRGTNDFRASRNGFHYAQMEYENSAAVLSVFGDGKGSVRAAVNPDKTVRLHINNQWGFSANQWLGPYLKEQRTTAKPGYDNSAVIYIADTPNNYKKHWD